MTDGTIYIDADGRETKAFNIYDGSGIHLVRKAGVEVGIVTGRQSPIVEFRARELGITEVYQRILDKVKIYDDLLRKYGLQDLEMAYMGDDVVDVPVLSRCGFACAPREAPEDVRHRVHFIPMAAAGHGAARELCEFILEAQGKLGRVLARFHR